MKVPCDEGVAIHIGPKSCAVACPAGGDGDECARDVRGEKACYEPWRREQGLPLAEITFAAQCRRERSFASTSS